MIVWRVMDGKPGHEGQTAGLVQSLAECRSLECHDIVAHRPLLTLAQWMSGQFKLGRELPAPDLILGAGHRTHFTVLAARKAYGGFSIVLMKPSLPAHLFDLCLIPEHDQPKDRSNIEKTCGVLNTVRPSGNASDECGLFLIGGPSSHHNWDEAATISHVLSIVRGDCQVKWLLTTSRRTPERTVAGLVALNEPNLEVIPFAQTEAGWVVERLKECGLVWVSEDSVSMVFEALTSGAKVGLLTVPSKSSGNRVLRGIQAICDQGHVLRYTSEAFDLKAWSQSAAPCLGEADRCATMILNLLDCRNHPL